MNKTAARKASEFVHVLSEDNYGKPKSVMVPGHRGAQYRVILRRENKGGTISTECALTFPGNLGYRNCEGNTNGHLCYHGLAAIMYAAAKGGYSLSLCDTKPIAEKLAHMGGHVIHIRSWQGKGEAWVVIKEAGK